MILLDHQVRVSCQSHDDSRPWKMSEGKFQQVWTSALLLIVGTAVGCQKSPPSLLSDVGTPKPEYKETVSAMEQLGVVAHCDDEGEVTYLDFFGVRDVSAAIEHVSKFPNLKLLNFSSTRLSDADMAHLADAQQLEELGIHGTQITDAGLSQIAGLSSLKILNLNDTGVGDEGLAHLSGLTNLRQLQLQSTQVTDAGMVHIEALKNLELVWLNGSQVTLAATERLRQSLPSAMIENEEIVETGVGPLLPASAIQE